MTNETLFVFAIVAAIAIVVFLAAFLHSRRASRERGSLFGPDYEGLLSKINRSADDHPAGALPLRR